MELWYVHPDLEAQLWQLSNLNHQVDRSKEHSLTLAVVRTFLPELTMACVPRLIYMGFSLAQPYLVNNTILYITFHTQLPLSHGYGLIGGYALCYTGIAVCVYGCSCSTASNLS